MPKIVVRVIDAYVFRRTREGIKFLILKRAKTKIYEHLWQGVAGKIEKNETAVEAATRELMEETGFFSNSDLKELLSLRPCTGRLSNRCWCYYLGNIKKNNNWKPEAGIDLVMTKSSELLKLIDDGHIQNSMHVSTIYKAYKEGLI